MYDILKNKKSHTFFSEQRRKFFFSELDEGSGDSVGKRPHTWSDKFLAQKIDFT